MPFSASHIIRCHNINWYSNANFLSSRIFITVLFFTTRFPTILSTKNLIYTVNCLLCDGKGYKSYLEELTSPRIKPGIHLNSLLVQKTIICGRCLKINDLPIFYLIPRITTYCNRNKNQILLCEVRHISEEIIFFHLQLWKRISIVQKLLQK